MNATIPAATIDDYLAGRGFTPYAVASCLEEGFRRVKDPADEDAGENRVYVFGRFVHCPLLLSSGLVRNANGTRSHGEHCVTNDSGVAAFLMNQEELLARRPGFPVGAFPVADAGQTADAATELAVVS